MTYGRSRYRDHQHPVVGAEYLVIDIDAHHRVRPQMNGAHFHFMHGIFSGFNQLLLISAGTTAEKIGKISGEILNKVYAGNHLPKDHALVFQNLLSLNGWRCCNNHGCASLADRTFQNQSVGRSNIIQIKFSVFSYAVTAGYIRKYNVSICKFTFKIVTRDGII